MKHKQVIRDRFGKDTQVDEGIADLLQLIWHCGIETYNSCQENLPGMAWIEFVTTGNCTNFLNFVAKYPPDSVPFGETLYGRITGLGEDSCNWKYNARLINYGVKEDIEAITTFDGFNDFCFSMSVRFPISDIPLLIELLNERIEDMVMIIGKKLPELNERALL